MGWGAVWQLALKQFNAEVVEIRLLIILMVAFSALMVVVGLRYAFRAAGPVAETPLPEQPKRAHAAAPPAVFAKPSSPAKAPTLRARKPVPQHVGRKSAKRTINRQRPTRPAIRRHTDAPYSPLAPRG